MKNLTILVVANLLITFMVVAFGQEMSFSADSVIHTGYTAVSVACADFDGDEALDIAVAINNEANFDPVAIFLNNGEGVLSTIADSMYLNSNSPKDIAAGDLNNDQIPDLATTIYDDSTVVLLFGNGDGTFTRGTDVATPTFPSTLLIVDVDKDLNNDLVVISHYGYLMIFKGIGDGSFAEPVNTTGIGSAHDVEAYDMNGDNYLDLIVGTGNLWAVNIYMNDGQGNFPIREGFSTPRVSWFVAAGDFNNDSHPDIAAGSGSYDFDNVYVMQNNGEGDYACSDTMSPGTYVNAIDAADYNNDRYLDILVGDRSGLYILNGTGDCKFSHVDTLAYDPNAYRVNKMVSADIDGNGRPDLVIARDQDISIYYNTGIFTSISKDIINPEEFSLSQNYPNPFNPSTIINYELPITNEVELSIYNLLGQRVVTLVSEKQAAGHHQVEFDASGFSSGIYFYRLKTENRQMIKKMQLLK